MHLSLSGIQSAALLLTVVVTAINCAPVLVNGRIATALAVLKIAMLSGVTFAAFALGRGAASYAQSGAAGACTGVDASLLGGSAGFAAALTGRCSPITAGIR